ncbi:MAG: hypothetical protein AB1391_02260 [Candidatus Micrarchaeota archaeon]
MVTQEAIKEIEKSIGPFMVPKTPKEHFIYPTGSVMNDFFQDVSSARNKYVDEIHKLPEYAKLINLNKKLSDIDKKMERLELGSDPYQNIEKIAKLMDERAQIVKPISETNKVFSAKKDEIEKRWVRKLEKIVSNYTKLTAQMMDQLPEYKYGFSFKTDFKQTMKGIWSNLCTFWSQLEESKEMHTILAEWLANNVEAAVKGQPLTDSDTIKKMVICKTGPLDVKNMYEIVRDSIVGITIPQNKSESPKLFVAISPSGPKFEAKGIHYVGPYETTSSTPYETFSSTLQGYTIPLINGATTINGINVKIVEEISDRMFVLEISSASGTKKIPMKVIGYHSESKF